MNKAQRITEILIALERLSISESIPNYLWADGVDPNELQGWVDGQLLLARDLALELKELLKDALIIFRNEQ